MRTKSGDPGTPPATAATNRGARESVQFYINALLRNGWRAADHQRGLLAVLRDELGTAKGTAPSNGGGTRGTRTGSPAPWNSAVAHLLVEIYVDTRNIYDDLTYAAPNYSPPPATGKPATGDELTELLLARLPALLDALHAQGSDALYERFAEIIEERLRSWHDRGLKILGETRHAAKIPLPCPHCYEMTLVLPPNDLTDAISRVECTNRDCRSAWTEGQLGWMWILIDAMEGKKP